MKIVLLGLIGLLLGLIAGGAIGMGVGAICVEIFQVSNFEGGAGMMVFFAFMPIGAILGGIAGAVLLGWIGARAKARA
jgi:hypothetical protein